MATRRHARHGWSTALLLSLALGLLLGWFLIVLGGVGSGSLSTFLRNGASTGVKLFANALVLSVAALCVWVLLRLSLEDLGLLRKRDQWIDWRESPSPELLQGPALGDSYTSARPGASTPIPAWPTRTLLRAHRGPGARTSWGFNRRQPN